MIKIAAFCFSLLFLWTSQGCQLINPPEPIPTYLVIDSLDFIVQDPDKEGTGRQQIQCVWVYLDNDALGVFDLPTQIPILSENSGLLRIVPGVIYGGMKDFVVPYPFFQADTAMYHPNPGGEIRLQPRTHYFPDVRFAWKEDFEVGNSWIPANVGLEDDTSLHRINQPDLVFEGNGAGMIALDQKHPFSENITNNGFPLSESNAYVELHYKSTAPFEVGLLVQGSGQIVVEYLFGVHPQDEWNKIYFGLSSFLSTYKGSSYRLMIRSHLPEGQETGYVLIDNMKILSF